MRHFKKSSVLVGLFHLRQSSQQNVLLRILHEQVIYRQFTYLKRVIIILHSSFLVNVDARGPADTPFYRRWPRFPRGCGADMEQLVEISHIVAFTGIL